MLYEAETRQLKVAAVGDITMTEHISSHREDGFLSLVQILRDADVAFGHVEAPIVGTEGYPSHDAGVYLKQEPWAADEIKWLGIKIVSCAANHSLDYAVGGLLATIENLDRAGIAHSGSGRNLDEARTPGYYTSAKGRVALISLCSFFSPWSRAGEQRPNCVGRPGINPLRYETSYIVDARALQDLKRISEMLGLEKEKAGKAKFSMFSRPLVDTGTTFHFLPTDVMGLNYNKFVLGDKPAIDTVANETDVKETIGWIKDAKKQADWVLISLHGHEADGERGVPARFMRPFAKACIDAGADAFIGHGPHVVRGIEIYKGRPIFYSLGNFIQQIDTVGRQPADFYERYGLDPEARPQETWDAFSKNDTCGFAAESRFWESVCATFTFKEDRLAEVRLYPLTLGYGKRRSQRGLPLLADEALSKKIIEQMSTLSKPFGTRIDFKDGTGLVAL